MLFGITAAFWVGMGVVAFIVIAGCLAAWLLPPSKKKSGGTVHSASGEIPSSAK